MPPTSSLNPTGQFFELQLIEAWELLQAEKYDAANAISHSMLLEPAMSDVHRAGFHVILAHSFDRASEHAREAVRLYEAMFENVEHPSEAEVEAQQKLVRYAKVILAETVEDELRIGNGYSEEELLADIIEEGVNLAMAEAAAEAAFEAAADPTGATDELEIVFIDKVPSNSIMPQDVQVHVDEDLGQGEAHRSDSSIETDSSATQAEPSAMAVTTIKPKADEKDKVNTVAPEAPSSAISGLDPEMEEPEWDSDMERATTPILHSTMPDGDEEEFASPRLPAPSHTHPQPRSDIPDPAWSPGSS